MIRAVQLQPDQHPALLRSRTTRNNHQPKSLPPVLNSCRRKGRGARAPMSKPRTMTARRLSRTALWRPRIDTASAARLVRCTKMMSMLHKGSTSDHRRSGYSPCFLRKTEMRRSRDLFGLLTWVTRQPDTKPCLMSGAKQITITPCVCRTDCCAYPPICSALYNNCAVRTSHATSGSTLCASTKQRQKKKGQVW